MDINALSDLYIIEEYRRNNIILYKVPESGAVSADKRNNEDENFCLGLFNVINSGVVKEDISKLIRLGKRGDVTSDCPRPLLVKLQSRLPKNLMENLSKLRHVEAKYKTVKVAHDMKIKERKEIRDLVQVA